MAPMLDDDQAALIAAAEQAGMPQVSDDLLAVRARVAALSNRSGAEVAVVEDHELDGPHGPLLVRQYAATPEPEQPALVYFHGGGMVLGSVESSDALCRQLCAESGVTIFSVDYRLAPEHKYPVATDEAYFATEWVAGHADRLGVDPWRLAVGGDSAGGSLAAGVTLQARDRGGPALVLQILVYPGLERSADRPSMLAFANGPGLTRATIDWMKEQYLGPDPALDTLYGVPALADSLAGLPEAVVVVASADPLRDGAEAYADRLFEAGVQTTIMRYPGLVHGFLSNIKKLSRADRCVSDVAAALKSRVSSRGQPEDRAATQRDGESYQEGDATILTESVAETRRARIEEAIAVLDPITTLLCLIQQTGDRSLLRRYWDDLDGTQARVDRFVGRTQEDGNRKVVPAAIDRELRDRLLDALLPGTPPRIPRPDEALFAQLGRLATGFEVDVEKSPYFLEQAGFVTDRRDVPAVRVPPEDFEVLVIGAGMVGINAGIKLASAGFAYRILEAQPQLGGTWWINRYPNAAVDTPALGYSYSFEPNLEWSRYYPDGPEYFDYLNRVADKYGVRDRIDFRTRMLSCEWIEADQIWRVTAERDGQPVTYQANAVITALGHLNRPFIPHIENMDAFEGPVVHTTDWTPEIDRSIAGLSVVVVGTGCTSAQLVTGIADRLEKLSIIQRQTQWYLPNDMVFRTVPEEDKAAYQLVPFSYQWARARTVIEQATRARDYLRFDPEWHERTGGFSEANDRMRDIGLRYLNDTFSDRPDLIEKLTPDFPPFAKRPIIDPGYLQTLRKPNVELVTGELRGFEKDGVVLADGTKIPCDMVVLATGFSLDFLTTPHDIRGRGGVTIAEQWATKPEAYLGVMAPGFPNFFITSGPNSGVSGSGHSMMGEEQVHYIVGALQTMVNDGITSMDVKSEVTREYNAELEQMIERTVWKRSGTAHGYYRRGGAVVLGYPKPNFEYWRASRKPDLTHFTITTMPEHQSMTTPQPLSRSEEEHESELDLTAQKS